ncbi:HAD-IC family P-type ATPase [Calothrix sp. NIES-3974]|uniref:HAD-IC family P-type ATPase n=1 Tax=Calothrix sp. NIES-3974 TaxID=2005462 RepID=UPI000B5F9DBD|nr:cation-translocating P-type ATPase [Calothrix sp. NIES-3974]BAZ05714.1 putative calcium-transporting ATPase [Calothrix sp. NIES-3974]
MSNWHQIDAAQALQNLGTIDFYGLSHEEVNRRLAHYGANELVERPGKTSWQILWEQFTATTVLVLIAAAVISGILGDYKDTIAILAIVVFNALLGFNQEYRAGMAFAALKKLAVPTVRVCRQGHWEQIVARKLVPGDLILLEAGDLVPADCRLLESINLMAQESAFTGESEAVEKNSLPVEGADLPLGDRPSADLSVRHNMVYMGTVITYGNKPILAAVALTLILQLAVVYIPWLRSLFQTQPLSTQELILCLVISTVGFWAMEIKKWVIRRRSHHRGLFAN